MIGQVTAPTPVLQLHQRLRLLGQQLLGLDDQEVMPHPHPSSRLRHRHVSTFPSFEWAEVWTTGGFKSERNAPVTSPKLPAALGTEAPPFLPPTLLACASWLLGRCTPLHALTVTLPPLLSAPQVQVVHGRLQHLLWRRHRGRAQLQRHIHRRLHRLLLLLHAQVREQRNHRRRVLHAPGQQPAGPARAQHVPAGRQAPAQPAVSRRRPLGRHFSLACTKQQAQTSSLQCSEHLHRRP